MKILDAKYKKANPHEIASAQEHLTPHEQEQLQELLHKHELLMDGTLGQWVGDPYDIQLKPGAKPYHANVFPVPCVHLNIFKCKIEWYVKIGVLKRVNHSEWAVPYYLIPKPDELVREDASPAHHEIGHLRYKTYALHVTVLWDRVVINAQMVRIAVACLEIVGGMTLMQTYVLASDTNANYLAHAHFDVLAFVRSCVRLCVRDLRVWDQVM
jgi:hypothetical protein